MTVSEADKALDRLTAYYPRHKLDRQTQGVFLGKLAPLDYEVALQAIDRAADEQKFFPSWAEIWAHYVEVERERQLRQVALDSAIIPALPPGPLPITAATRLAFQVAWCIDRLTELAEQLDRESAWSRRNAPMPRQTYEQWSELGHRLGVQRKEAQPHILHESA